MSKSLLLARSGSRIYCMARVSTNTHVKRFYATECEKTNSGKSPSKTSDKVKQLKVKQTVISSHLQLHEIDYSEKVRDVNYSGKRMAPLVIIFNWLNAKPTAVQKYSALYHSIGLDVLNVQGNLGSFLWPPLGYKITLELFEYLKEHQTPHRQYFVHAFSLGAYIYTIALEQAAGKPEESGHFRKRVLGQIFDSIVVGTYDNMSQGITQILPQNKAFQLAVLKTLDSYYRITHRTTKDTYDRLVKHFKDEPLYVPTLIFYSRDDPMCCADTMDAMLALWRSQRPNFPYESVSWPQSRHVAHLKEHPTEYLAAWTKLMSQLQLA